MEFSAKQIATFIQGEIVGDENATVHTFAKIEAGTAAELDWLLYNKLLEYAQMVLGGEIEHFLSLGCDHGGLED